MLPTITLFNVEINLYFVFNYLALVIMLAAWMTKFKAYKNLSTYPALLGKKRTKPFYKTRTAFTVYEMLLLAIVFGGVGYFMNDKLGRLFTNGNANYFGNLFFSPIGFLLLCVLLKVDPLKSLDMITPAAAICLCVSKIGCVMAGCCYGYSAESFYYNTIHGQTEFPIQIVESICALVIFIILLVMSHRKKHSGILYPWYMILYSAPRFFSEFARDDLPIVVGFLKSYQVLCLIGIFLGVVGLFAVRKLEERSETFTQRAKDKVNQKYRRELHPRNQKKKK